MALKPEIEILDAALKLSIIYNPFDITNVVKDELVFQPGKSLSYYLTGLPHPDTWLVGLNGTPCAADQLHLTFPKAGDAITLVHTPEGGDAKDIIRIVALIALAVYAPQLAAAWLPNLGAFTAFAEAAATIAIMIGGSMLINSILPPPSPELSSVDQQTTYGIDGAKNTAKPGSVVPVIYGTHRYGGNIVDCYTQNVGDTQYLYIRTVLNDGQVDAITDVEINNQPIANYTDIETRVSLGVDPAPANDWFVSAIALQHVGTEITTTNLIYNTTGAVDRLRLDFLAPRGLVEFDDEGKTKKRTVGMVVEYRAEGDSTWLAFPTSIWQPFTTFSAASASRLKVTVRANPLPFSDQEKEVAVTVQYRKQGETAWVGFGSSTGRYYQPAPAMFNAGLFIQFHGGGNDPAVFLRDYEANVEPGIYEVRVLGGEILNRYAFSPNAAGSTFTLSGSSTKAIRHTLETGTLPRDNYEVRVRRTTAPSTENTILDNVYLSDVGEIDNTNVNYNGTATLSLKIKLGEQINGLPTVTALVTGSLLKEYDEVGELTFERYSANPAWAAMDVLQNEFRGASLDVSKFDYPSWLEWAEFCQDAGIEFNGVFDFKSNVWDALQTICRVGRAQPIRIGSKYGVVIDRAAPITGEFNGTNILKDSLTVTWLPMTDRANEIELSYFDREDGFKQKTIRLTDDSVALPGETRRVASFSQIGITQVDQAAEEAELQLRRNKLLRKTVQFDAPLEAIGVQFGDVVALHHDAADYTNGRGGRLEAGSTTTVLKLDRDVTLETGVEYKALVYQEAFAKYIVNIESIAGSNVFISGLPDGEIDRVSRIRQGGTDLAIINIHEASPHDRLVVEDSTGLSTGSATLWTTHVVEEREVTTGPGTVSEVTLESALTVAPPQYAKYIVGRTEAVKQLFRVTGISGEDLHRRTINLVNYTDDLYLPAGVTLPTPVILPVNAADQVTDLSFSFDQITSGPTQRHYIDLAWNTPNLTNYGGADIYIDEDSKGWVRVGTVQDVTSYRFELLNDRLLLFKVVGFNRQGRRALASQAPTITAGVETVDLEIPEITVTSELVEGPASSRPAIVVAWTAPEDTRVNRIRIEVTPTAGGVTTVGERDGDLTGDTELLITEGIAEDTQYTVRARFQSNEFRSEWSDPETVTSAEEYSVPHAGEADAPAPGGAIESSFDEMDAALATAQADLDALTEVFGDTASAAASASAAATHAANAAAAETNAETAQAASETAMEAAEAFLADTNVAKGLAETAATNASNSATTAGTAATNASTANGLAQTAKTAAETAATTAGTSATNANNSATAAAGSATAAGTSATNAGNSASAAAASVVSAQSVANILIPDRVSEIQNFVGTGGTSPTASTPLSTGTTVTVAGEGDVRQFTSNVNVLTRGGLALVAGHTYRNQVRTRVTVDGTGNRTISGFHAFDANWTALGVVGWVVDDSSFVVADGWQTFTQEVSTATVLAAYPTAAYIRGRITGGSNSGNTASGATWQAAFLRLTDASAEVAAGASATAAATSASTAGTHATNAGTSAGAANTSATNAATSAGNAATSAGQASTSETNAAGSASTASTHATNAAGSATTAGGSATAAAGSATTAGTHATNAGNSATSASASAVSAQSSANRILPDRVSKKADFLNSTSQGDPDSSSTTISTAGTVVTVAGHGDVLEFSALSNVLTRGALSVGTGRTFRIEHTQRVTADGTDNRAITWFQIYDASWTSLTTIGITHDSNFVAADGWQTFTQETTSAAIIAVAPTAAYIRARVAICRNGAGTQSGATMQLEMLRLRDVSIEAAAAGSASAAATSASSAGTHATNAGTSASAASTSATNAATSAGAASTSETNAANSATTASGHAATATTQAGLAAGSATAAGGSATAANTSAGNAATSATNAGNSATAANTSAVTAQSVANRLMPSRPSVASDFVAASNAGAPDTATPLSTGSVVAVAGEGDVRQFSGLQQVFTRGGFQPIAGRTYRLSVRARVTVDGTGNRIRMCLWCFDSAWANLSVAGLNTPDASFVVADGWQTFTADITTTQIMAASASTANVRPWVVSGENGSGTTSGATWQIASLGVQDVTSELAAAGSASAAATSASTAGTHATNAGTSASAANTSATNANTSAGDAATSAGQAATSATTASGHASTASTHATNAANSYTNLINTVRAAPVGPYDFRDGLIHFTDSRAGNPTTQATMTSGTLVTDDADFGNCANVTTFTTAGHNVLTKAVVPATPGRIYRVSIRFKVTASDGSVNFNLICSGLNAAYAQTTTATVAPITVTTGAVQEITTTFGSDTLAGAANAWPASSNWMRFGLRLNSSETGLVVRIGQIRVEDVTEQVAAATAATAAATSASTASTAATNAGNSATSATTSANTARSVANRLLPDRPGEDPAAFTHAFTTYTDPATMTTGSAVAVANEGTVWQIAGQNDIMTKAALPVIAGRTYRVTHRSRVTVDGTGTNQWQVWLRCFAADGTYLGAHSVLGASDTSTNFAEGWQTLTADVTTAQIVASFATTAYVKVDLRGGHATGSTWQCALLQFRDASVEVAAAASASAASTSASSASTSATNAGTSASAANTSATNANTSAGQASTSAGQASTSAGEAAASAITAGTHASNASGSATTASGHATTAGTHATNAAASATLAATYYNSGASGLLINNKFQSPLVSGVPTGFTSWTGTGTQVTRVGGSGYAFRQAGAAGVNAGIQQNTTAASMQPGPYLIRVVARRISGSLDGAGIYISWRNSSNAQISTETMVLSTTPNMAGVTTSTPDGVTTWEKQVTAPATAVYCQFYVMTHYSVLGSTAVANSIDWHEVDISAIGTAHARLTVAEAAITTNATAIATETSARTTEASTLRAVMYGRSDNVIPDADMRDTAWWGAPAGVTLGDANSGWAQRRYMTLDAGNYDFYSQYFPVEIGATYRIKARIWTGAGFSGWFHPMIHMPSYQWFSLKHGTAVNPVTHDATNGIVAAGDTLDLEWTVTNPFGVSANANKQWQFRMYGQWTGNAAVVAVEINRLDQYAQVQQIKTAVTDAGGSYAYYGMKVGAGNRFASIEAMASTKTNVSQLKMTADKFTVQTASTDKQVFSVTGSLVQIDADLNVASGITVGAARLKVALESIRKTGADGAAITWAGGVNIGSIPEYVLDISSLTPLTTGEQYSVALTGVTATGATVYAKIITPGTTSTVSQTVDAAGGGGNPGRVMAKSDSADAYDSTYNFRIVGTLAVTSYPDSELGYMHSGYMQVSTWFNDGGGWDAGPIIEVTLDAVGIGFFSAENLTGSWAYDITVPVTWTNPIGAGSTYDFGVTAGSGGTVTDLHTVSYTKQTSSGTRTASPSGETVKITAFPRNA